MTVAASFDAVGIGITAGMTLGLDEDINQKLHETVNNLKEKAVKSKEQFKEVGKSAGETFLSVEKAAISTASAIGTSVLVAATLGQDKDLTNKLK